MTSDLGPLGDGGLVMLAPGQQLSIMPSETTLDVTDLAHLPTLQLAAVVTTSGVNPQSVGASWKIDRLDIATVGAGTGLVSADGQGYGVATVTASISGASATTHVTVRLRAALNPAALSTAAQQQLDQASSPDPQVAKLAFPYDQTVFPRGLMPPELMWNGGAAGDKYRVHFTAPNFDLKVYTAADPPSRFSMTQAEWDALTATAAAGTVQVDVARLSGGNAYASASEKWNVADADLRGTIYYWSIAQGQIVKLDLASGQRSTVFDPGANNVAGTPAPFDDGSPRTPMWEDINSTNPTGKRCVGCHAVSKDGSTLVSTFAREGSQGPIGSVTLGTSTVKAVGDYETNGMMVAITPDAKYSVTNTSQKTMQLIDTATAHPVTSALDALTNVCDPTFSPDGKLFALATNCTLVGYGTNTGYVVEFNDSDLSLYDFDSSVPRLSNPRTLQTGAPGTAYAFPSFSPDSKWLFVQRGDYSRANYDIPNTTTLTHGNDDLYITSTQPGATPIALDAANGKGVLAANNLHLNYAPTVNPIAAGGYFWVVFTSPRDYGNRQALPVGQGPAANHKQLWVTAVDADPQPGKDPSHPAFWLPGQDVSTINMFGYWALSPCKASGPQASCSAGFECCSGYCRDSADGGAGAVCVDQPDGCHMEGEKCTSESDCCQSGVPLACEAGICQGHSIR